MTKEKMMITRFKDRIDAASYAELYALARGVLMDLEATKNGPSEVITEELVNTFEVYLPKKT